ncbi:MAG: LacI family DNA-binding transcriptional regulator [Granulosicoccus sp.]
MENNKKPVVTMEDVARAAGVSRMTVSRALKKDGLVSERTRERILKLVDKMNYVPDQMAGSLSTQRSGFVATLVPSINNVHYANMIQGLTEALERIGLQVLLGYTEYSAQREAALVESLLSRRPEAIVLPFDGHTDKTVKLLKQSQVPVFQLWEMPEKPIGYTIGFSNQEVAHNMTQDLINLGYENIAFLCETNDEWTRGAARRKGFKSAMESNGLSAHRMIRFGNPPMSIKDGYFVGMNLQQYYDDIDCVFCVSDAPAFGVMTALKEQGIIVPEDIGIAGFGNFEVSRYSVPDITTVKFDASSIGHLTAECIIELVEPNQSGKKPARKIKIEVNNCMRGSTSKRR